MPGCAYVDCVVTPFDHNHELPILAANKTESPGHIVDDPVGVMLATGPCVTITFTDNEVPLHPPVLITVTLTNPAVVIYILFVVDPFDHKYAKPGCEFSNAESPLQNITLPVGETVGVNFVKTVIINCCDCAMAPLLSKAKQVKICCPEESGARFIFPVILVPACMPPSLKT